MLEICKNNKGYTAIPIEEEDIIVERLEKETIQNKDGSITIKPVYKKVNITKLVNATKKLIVGETADEKLEKIKQAIREV